MKVGDLVQFGRSGLTTKGINGQIGILTEVNSTLKKGRVAWTNIPDCYYENNSWVYLRNITLVIRDKSNTSYL